VDEQLPKATLDAGQYLTMMFGNIIVTAIVNPIFLVPVAVCAVVFYKVRGVYLRSSRKVKRLESSARSPVFSLLADVLNDLPTVRALNAQKMLKLKVEDYQDTHSSAWFMYCSMSQSFGFLLDIMVLAFIAFITFGFLVMPKDGVSGAAVGLAITQGMGMTGNCTIKIMVFYFITNIFLALINWAVRQSAEVENLMTSVERSMEYAKLERETQPLPSKTVALEKVN
jgi:ATP-binding cassette, subfamily C (CFTR/MRP), member 4